MRNFTICIFQTDWHFVFTFCSLHIYCLHIGKPARFTKCLIMFKKLNNYRHIRKLIEKWHFCWSSKH